MKIDIVRIDGSSLSLESIYKVAEEAAIVYIPDFIRDNIINLRQRLEAQLRDFPEIKIYGTNRLHGDLKHLDVDYDLISTYQEKYIKVHNCATGRELPIPVVRAIMLLRLNSFAKGYSGMRWETIELLMDMLNKGLTPVVLEEGSVGASGDLVPLAMIAAAMIGLPEAEIYLEKWKYSAADALQRADLKPVRLGAKEAMGLTNGSSLITALATFAVRDAENLLRTASLAGALSLEAIRGEKDAFDDILHNNRPHPGQLKIAREMQELIQGSKRMTPEAQLHPFTRKKTFNKLQKLSRHPELSEEERKTIDEIAQSFKGEVRVQDRYSFRAIPQVHGPVYEAIAALKTSLRIEANSVTDNPLFKEVSIEEIRPSISDEAYQKLLKAKKKTIIKAYSGANFHGQVIAQYIDQLKIALTSLGLLSDKRSFSLLDKALNYHLPPDLAYDTKNADGGLMILQYAGAARAAENRVLASPSSTTSVSTSANQEDYVSMGVNGAFHLKKIIDNNRKILAIELLCALRAIQLTDKDLPSHLRELGDGTSRIYQFLSEHLGNGKEYLEDHYLRTDLQKMIYIVRKNELIKLLSPPVASDYDFDF